MALPSSDRRRFRRLASSRLGFVVYEAEDTYAGMCAVRRLADTAFGESWDDGAWIRSRLNDEMLLESYWSWLSCDERRKVFLMKQGVLAGFSYLTYFNRLRGIEWQGFSPDIICDTGHNSHGLKYISQHLEELSSKPGFGQLRIVLGMVNDKDVTDVLALMPQNARYYFTQASVQRALDASTLRDMARLTGLTGRVYRTVAQAVSTAQREASPEDLIFVGGSTFVVADLLTMPEFFIQG